VRTEASAQVLVGGVAFLFRRREDGDWEGDETVAAVRGYALTPRWLVAAEAVAREVFADALAQQPGGEAADTVTCPECGRVLCSSEIAAAPTDQRTGVRCGPEHLIHYRDGRALVVPAVGRSTWRLDPGDGL
jgi:hypothetical protein